MKTTNQVPSKPKEPSRNPPNELKPRTIKLPKNIDLSAFELRKVYVTGIPQKNNTVRIRGSEKTVLHWVITLECKRKSAKKVSSLRQKASSLGSKTSIGSKSQTSPGTKPKVSTSISAAAPAASSPVNNSETTETIDGDKSKSIYYFRIDQVIHKDDMDQYNKDKQSVPIQLKLVFIPSIFAFLTFPPSSSIGSLQTTGFQLLLVYPCFF